jgi:thiosulfate/3-mercaptopyruvate sulfurtransferase
MAHDSHDDPLLGKMVVSIPDAIKAHTSSSNVKFVDGSWWLAGRNGREDFTKGPRIKDAYFFDIDDIAGPPSNLPHMMPTKELFAAAMDSMNISNNDHIIVYGTEDCLIVQRAWFQIRNMGHNVDYMHMLEGSLAEWAAMGGPIEEGPPTNPVINAKDLDLSKTPNYKATDPQNIVDKEEMIQLINKGESADAIWVDVRSPERFQGKVEEPRPGMRLGHMPGGKNLFFRDLLQDDNVSKFKSKEELKKIIEDGGVDLTTKKRIICLCGSGATACTLVAALELVGVDQSQIYVYDGSWSEWGSLPDTPIVKD